MTAVITGQRIKLEGNEFYYEAFHHSKTAPTLILLHGFLSSTFSYRRLIPHLNASYNIVSIDLPPFGQSGKEQRFMYSYQNLAKTVISLLERLEIGHSVLVGHSMGGQIALNMIKQRPELFAACILLCSSGYAPKVNQGIILSSYIPFFHLYVKRWLAKTGIEKNLQNVVYNHDLIDQEMVDGYLQPFLKDDIFRGLARFIRHHEGDLPEADLRKIHTPCLLIWGEQDKVVPLHIGKRLQRDLPNSKLIVMKDTGHLVPEEKPEEVFGYINHFLEETFK
ncbi:alpha/beta hydrolase [Peribacillus saganii]|uniref:Alpha/beta hydrolase n=1 Tax=Peribacillus saganii TaxID=2303992 RepID=A0A372LPW7_9BACI|nr:alpha/beta hydrolase [Peribacillus saganii]RFU70166.1 alpha/beta hydrolase [Peribacillus saganii]